MHNILPCPVCGGQPKLSTLEPEHKSSKYFCSVHISCGEWKETNELAIIEWNRRVKSYIGLAQNTHEQEMRKYIKSAIENLELAQNEVEVFEDDKFNDEQSIELNQMYEKVSKSIKLLENIDNDKTHKCMYCSGDVDKRDYLITDGHDGMYINSNNILTGYEYFGLYDKLINYCPMCGKKL